MNQTLTLACLIAAGVGLVLQNTLMVRITQSASTILIAMLLNSLVGIVIFVTILLLKHGAAGFQELAISVKWWTLIPGLLGSFFVFASISGYQNVGAATTIAVLIASQLVGGVSDRSDSRAPRPASRAGWPALRRGDAGGRRLAGGQTPVLAAKLVNFAAAGQLLPARLLLLVLLAAMVGDGSPQTLLLNVALFPSQLRVIAQRDQQFIHVGNDAFGNRGVHARDDLIQMRHVFLLAA